MAGSKMKHDWFQEKIKEKPELAGLHLPLNEIVVKATEYGLYIDGWTLTRPDVYIMTRNPTMEEMEEYIIEVKSGNNARLFGKMMSQLERTAYCYQHHGLPEPDIRGWMPSVDHGRTWIEQLRNPKIYRPGDSFENPTLRRHV